MRRHQGGGREHSINRAASGVRQVGVRCCGRGGRRQLCSLFPFLGAASYSRGYHQPHRGGHLHHPEHQLHRQGLPVLAVLHQEHLQEQYVGDTGRSLYVRLKENKDSAQTGVAPCPVGQHFQLPGHSTRDMVMIPLEVVRGILPPESRGREI